MRAFLIICCLALARAAIPEHEVRSHICIFNRSAMCYFPCTRHARARVVPAEAHATPARMDPKSAPCGVLRRRSLLTRPVLLIRRQITSLPGWDGPLPVKQYSGYLPVGKTSGVPGFIHCT